MKDLMVWADCEMTGLDPIKDALIEVAVLVTDAELNVLGDGVDLVISAPETALESMPDIVREMHTKSGLIDEVRGCTRTLAEAQDEVLSYAKTYVSSGKGVPLCGNSIATDRNFLTRDMPEFMDLLHYRMIDVSTIKELCRRWYPRVYFAKPQKAEAHRALADIRESINELRYYRETVFADMPGPSSDDARSVAARIFGDQSQSA